MVFLESGLKKARVGEWNKDSLFAICCKSSLRAAHVASILPEPADKSSLRVGTRAIEEEENENEKEVKLKLWLKLFPSSSFRLLCLSFSFGSSFSSSFSSSLAFGVQNQ